LPSLFHDNLDKKTIRKANFSLGKKPMPRRPVTDNAGLAINKRTIKK
jgi:hypothetical protein